MTEAEFHRAAFATPAGRDRRHPWGETFDRAAERGNLDFARFDPLPVGAFPGGASAFGVHDLVGNGWEWTSDVFAPFDGFTPLPSYPEYSADFFDGRAFRAQGRVADDRTGPRAARLPQLVPAAVPVRLRHVPLRAGRVMQPTPALDDRAAFTAAFAADLADALRRQPRQIPSTYLYDELGSALFEAICRLPWYRITRAEIGDARSALRARFSVHSGGRSASPSWGAAAEKRSRCWRARRVNGSRSFS